MVATRGWPSAAKTSSKFNAVTCFSPSLNDACGRALSQQLLARCCRQIQAQGTEGGVSETADLFLQTSMLDTTACNTSHDSKLAAVSDTMYGICHKTKGLVTHITRTTDIDRMVDVRDTVHALRMATPEHEDGNRMRTTCTVSHIRADKHFHTIGGSM